MTIENCLASVAVTELAHAAKWYEKVLGKPADSKSVPKVQEWKFEHGGGLQVYELPERAGNCSLTLAVTSIDDEVARLSRMGIDTRERASGTQARTLRVANRGAYGLTLIAPQGTVGTRSVLACVPTQSVGTRGSWPTVRHA